MSSRSFRSVFMVASCAGAALGCYLVSLRVASERAALENVETEIVMAQRDIRVLQTEIGTRGRLAQLERWNVKVLALSAPSADQFLEGGFALAKMVAPRGDAVDLEAPVVLASAPANGPKPQIQGAPQPSSDQDDGGVSARQMMHVASIKRESRPIAEEPPKASKAEAAPAKAGAKPVVEPKMASKTPASTKSETGAKRTEAKPKAEAKAKAAAKPKPLAVDRKSAAADPLAPIPSSSKPKKVAASASPASVKENGSKQ
jgi:hypothetical protein